ncbi:ABC transporter permease subunit, partial [Brucella anthropi]
MLGLVFRRISVLIPTFIGVSIIAFAFIRLLPGDPVILLSGERGMSPERHAQINQQLGLDRPLVTQFFDYLGGVLTGDFGTSIISKQPVLDQFWTLFPATVELSFCAIIIAIVCGIPAGVIAAVKRGSIFDQSLMGVALVGYSMPIFWWGLL